MRQFLATGVIPSPKLLVKDYKTIDWKGGFPTRLVIPATDVTTPLSKLGYLGEKEYWATIRWINRASPLSKNNT